MAHLGRDAATGHLLHRAPAGEKHLATCAATLDRWRPCDRVDDDDSSEDIFLPADVYDDAPEGEEVIRIDDSWRCHELVSREQAGTEETFTTIDYEPDCEDIDCTCEVDIACLKISGYAGFFFGNVKKDFAGVCTTSGFGAVGGGFLWDGEMPKTAACGWSGGLFYNNEGGGSSWQVTGSVEWRAAESRWRLQIQFADGFASGAANFYKDGEDSPLGTYEFDAASSPLYANAACYLMSPQSIDIIEC